MQGEKSAGGYSCVFIDKIIGSTIGIERCDELELPTLFVTIFIKTVFAFA
jgi:hypothetical protein